MARIVVLTTTLNDWVSLCSLLPLIDGELTRIGCRGSVVVVDDGSWEFEGKNEIGATGFTAIETVKVVTLYRNLGNQRAVAVGMAYATAQFDADYLILMDGDHEDNPTYIPALIDECHRHQDRRMVFAARTGRSEGWIFKVCYRIYQRIYRLLTGVSIDIGNYSLLPWRIATKASYVGELWNHFPAAIMRARIPFVTIPAKRSQRIAGQSKMNMVSLVTHAISGFAVHGDTVAVRALLGAGILAFVGLVLGAVLMGIKILTDLPIIGWTSQVGGLLILFLFQLLIGSGMLVFLVVTLRLQPPSIPAFEFRKYVFEEETLVGDPTNGQVSAQTEIPKKV